MREVIDNGSMPKNMRQIGEPGTGIRILVEDYAYTYLCQLARENLTGMSTVILLGKIREDQAVCVQGAMELDMGQELEQWFSGESWRAIFERIKTWFEDLEIVGWGLLNPGFPPALTERLTAIHNRHFPGKYQVFFQMDILDNEEVFYVREASGLLPRSGYYIYYEKNDPMQAYMIDMSENKSIEETEHVPDRAVIDFRRTVRGKKKETTESEKSEKAKKHSARNRWLAGACCAAAMLAVGLPYLRQYQNVEEVVQTEGQSVAVTSEAQKAAEEPLLSPMATEEPEESLAPVPTQDTTQESLNPQTNGETSEEVSISPTQESMQQEEKKEEQQAAADIKTITYTIQRGDTLTSICQKRYGTISRIDEICQLNGISPEDIIYAGGKLLLPES